jgi:hypothetical protein
MVDRLTLLAGALAAMSTGCTLVGLGMGAAVGAATPRDVGVDPRAQSKPPSIGDLVEVSVAVRGPGEERLRGDYGGVRDGTLILLHTDATLCAWAVAADRAAAELPVDAAACTLPLGSVRELRVLLRRETYWIQGMGLGFFIGAALDMGLAVALTRSR